MPPHSANSQPPFIDKLLNEAQFGVPVFLTNIASLTKTVSCYYRGMSATFQFEIETAEEQQRHLQQIETKQFELNQEIRTDLLNTTFRQCVETIMKRKIGLLFIKNEYNKYLQNHLSSCQEKIILQCQTSTDFQQTMMTLLTMETRKFEANVLQKYLQLDNALTALSEFNVYFHYAEIDVRDDVSLFESNKTLQDKKVAVESLRVLALNEQIPVEQRLQELKTVSHSAPFKINILKHRKFDRSNFSWLCQCLLRLLSALHLYQPTYHKHYQTLAESIDTEPKLSSSMQRHSLFAPRERAYDLPTATNEPSSLPAVPT